MTFHKESQNHLTVSVTQVVTIAELMKKMRHMSLEDNVSNMCLKFITLK